MKVITKIGGGGISDVFLVTDDIKKYAFKTLNHYKTSDRIACIHLRNEFSILQRIHHKNIIRCIAWTVIDGREGILMEFFDGINLMELPKSKFTKSLFIEIEKTIVFINKMSPPILHNDITEKNILVGSNNALKLIDFSMSYSDSLESSFFNQQYKLNTDIEQFKNIKKKYN